ncbi:hypothetical protein N7539_000164 [Penicillium diatomitis]|uniref:SAP domain-containing protein n=1 Tax=Penicillium diatomitis TaxID=2819901 RepID=A0A9W9XL86_9EURO|nr:uncharacterized protein N7539_000164 [Penicillium diatomitis]KAJ5495048.1 hypothetical protein N7539_000164 [Penicillium diatomitis]
MADYSSWKVADLKAELKRRGIPQTGLRLKQQFIDKLSEEDAKAQTTDAAVAPADSVPTEQVHEAAITQDIEASETQKESSAQKPVQPQQTSTPTQPAPVSENEAVTEPSKPHKSEAALSSHENSNTPTVSAAEETAHQNSSHLESAEHPATVTDHTTAPEIEQATREPATTPEVSSTLGHAAAETLAQHESPQPESDQPTAPHTEQTTPPELEQATKEPAASTEIAPSTILTSGENTGLSTPLPVEELLEDKRKRKRRSQSPLPTPEAIAQKKVRAEEESPRVILKDDLPIGADPKEVVQSKLPQENITHEDPPAPPKQDARFRGLFAAEAARPSPAQAASPTGDVEMTDAPAEPAIHPATRSLYIDGLMRPLQPNSLRYHLVRLASMPEQADNPDIIQLFWLDPIKTHCFVQFVDIAAASRVRNALHGIVWPNERNRKGLWVDFAPDEQISDWIQIEEAARDRAGPAPRWEVRYEANKDGAIASLVEAGSSSNARMNAARAQELGFARAPPSGPRAALTQSERRPSRTVAAAAAPARAAQGFKPLDELFQSTTTKPKLYYLRVPREVADKRLDQFDELIRKGPTRREGGDEMRRITFEQQDQFVDVGPEYGPGAQRRGRGGGPGGRRGGGGGWR